jgi:putative NADH-flavin reductase
VKANILNSEEIVKHLEGQDAVLSALGVPGIHILRISLYSDSIKSIVAAMRKANIKRLLCITSLYTQRKY